MDSNEILKAFGVDVPEKIENFEEFKLQAIETIKETTKKNLFEDSKFFESIPVEKLPPTIFNTKFNEARDGQKAKLIKAIESIAGVKLDLEEVSKAKDSDSVFSIAYEKIKALTGDDKTNIISEWQSKASQLESQLNELNQNSEKLLEAKILEKKDEIYKELQEQFKQKEINSLVDKNLISEINTETKFIPTLDQDLITKVGIEYLNSLYHVLYTSNGIELRDKSNKELKVIKKGTVAEPLTPKDALKEFYKSKGMFSTEKTPFDKEIIKVPLDPSNEKLSNEMLARMQKAESNLNK